MWTTPSLEDPLKLPESDDNILSLFNNNDRAKDLGFHSSESEYISLDRLEDRNRGAMVSYESECITLEIWRNHFCLTIVMFVSAIIQSPTKYSESVG